MDVLDIYQEVDLEDCPFCGGPGSLEFEYDWVAYIACADCGCRTAEFIYRSEDEKRKAVHQAADTWNAGKAVPVEPGT